MKPPLPSPTDPQLVTPPTQTLLQQALPPHSDTSHLPDEPGGASEA